mmetsp:Transcript_20059/g.55839  ORF Transcript_20059/g.55839 Transcript_20059/m.55839 type:complete len:548 (-) Transcript_20059:407-2050(-)
MQAGLNFLCRQLQAHLHFRQKLIQSLLIAAPLLGTQFVHPAHDIKVLVSKLCDVSHWLFHNHLFQLFSILFWIGSGPLLAPLLAHKLTYILTKGAQRVLGTMNINSLLPKNQRRKPCCKNRKAPWMEGTLDTTYRENYVEKEIPRETARPREPLFKDPTFPFDGTTTMNADYKPFQVQREGPIRPANTIMKDNAPFSGDSMYKADYGPKEAKYERVRPRNAYQPNPEPFDGTTTQKTDYQARGVPAPPPPATKASNFPVSPGPFEGTSVYKDTYQRWPASKREPAPAAKASNIMSGGSFDGTTMYRTNYVPMEIGKREACRPQDANPQVGPRHYDEIPSSEYKSTFVGKDVPSPMPRSVRPAHFQQPSAPFDGTTTNKTDFVPYQVPAEGARAARPQPALHVEKQPFQGQSTYRDTFIPRDAPYRRVKPDNSFQPNPARFDDTTTHKTTFVPFAVPATRGPLAPQSTLDKEKHPFEGQTTYKDDYRKMPGGLRADRKITKGGQFESGPFDGTTTYRRDFDEKEIPRQPARRPDEDCESCDSDPNCID